MPHGPLQSFAEIVAPRTDGVSERDWQESGGRCASTSNCRKARTSTTCQSLSRSAASAQRVGTSRRSAATRDRVGGIGAGLAGTLRGRDADETLVRVGYMIDYSEVERARWAGSPNSRA